MFSNLPNRKHLFFVCTNENKLIFKEQIRSTPWKISDQILAKNNPI